MEVYALRVCVSTIRCSLCRGSPAPRSCALVMGHVGCDVDLAADLAAAVRTAERNSLFPSHGEILGDIDIPSSSNLHLHLSIQVPLIKNAALSLSLARSVVQLVNKGRHCCVFVSL